MNPEQPVNSDTPIATQEPPRPGADIETGLAVIQGMDILTLESFPLQINVMLKGNLPDGCTQIGTVDQSFDAAAKTFTLKVSTTRPAGMMCTEALVPFEKSVALDVKGLAKGTYTVNANGHIGTFELAMDNGPLAAP
jgi:inhibitor of cysteine peptidase